MNIGGIAAGHVNLKRERERARESNRNIESGACVSLREGFCMSIRHQVPERELIIIESVIFIHFFVYQVGLSMDGMDGMEHGAWNTKTGLTLELHRIVRTKFMLLL